MKLPIGVTKSRGLWKAEIGRLVKKSANKATEVDEGETRDIFGEKSASVHNGGGKGGRIGDGMGTGEGEGEVENEREVRNISGPDTTSMTTVVRRSVEVTRSGKKTIRPQRAGGPSRGAADASVPCTKAVEVSTYLFLPNTTGTNLPRLASRDDHD
ncbi:hypothetical protein FHL15_004601 [Xylaria flabelliformis]|uniref:Uncharacterized protein n=1 Tax=Xylaria flabelliformis TaxID=2512241 RepID=A0A553I2M3_9PEZI|nr:hypothetical protein FHL15_004601 [Xylaria flabelliformis]